MKNIIILGAGTGGTLMSNLLSHRLNQKEWKVTVIDKADEHSYQPGWLFIPMRLYGYEDRRDVVKNITEPLPNSVQFVKSAVKLIDHENKTVETDAGKFSYDWLVSAMGCHIAPDEIEGMGEAMGRDVFTFYELDQALALQNAMDKMEEGRLVIDVAEMPIKCPVAPIEFAFLADYYFHLRGIRERIDITLVTPFSGAFTKPVANKILSNVAQEKRINIVPNFSMESVDVGSKTIHSYEGESLEFDLLCAIPPNLGPDVIDESGLGDGSGYVMTEPRTLKARKADHIYVLGDNSNVTTSKAGSVTHFEADTVVENLLREIDGKSPRPSFDGHANCFIETGYHKAMLLDFNYDMEPLPGKFPLSGLGPFSLLEESYVNHVGKIAFKWVYWNMLLPGHLPKVPLLPSHMNFLGKEIREAPQIRRAESMQVGAVMTREVVTVSVGTPLSEAASLLGEHRISSLPVVDVDGTLVGIITEADFLGALRIKGDSSVEKLFDSVIGRKRPKKRMGTIVDDLMTANPVTVRESDDLERAIDLMEQNGIKRLVVSGDDGQVTGIISRADLMRLFVMKG